MWTSSSAERRPTRDAGRGRARLLPAVIGVAALAAVLAAPAVSAQEPPRLTAPVNDYAGVIDPESATELDRLTRALQEATGDTVIVATVRRVAPFADIRELAVKMFENRGRGIGERGKDNGLLVLVAVDDRRVWVEVGYGLEGVIPDGFAGDVSRNQMAPRFREGEYGRGLVAGVSRLMERIAAERGVRLTDLPEVPATPSPGPEGSIPLQVPLWVIIVVLLVVIALANQPKRRRGYHWGGPPWSGWGGGYGGFGGGRSGGGGGGASW